MEGGVASGDQPDSAGVTNVTAGRLLRQARESAGLHIAALAVALKVPVGKLESLEADDYSAMPDTVFVRALASSVCRALKVDPSPVLALLPKNERPQLASGGVGINAPVKGGGSRHTSPALTKPRSASLTYAVVALLLGALLLVLLPQDFSSLGISLGDSPSGASLSTGGSPGVVAGGAPPSAESVPKAASADASAAAVDAPGSALASSAGPSVPALISSGGTSSLSVPEPPSRAASVTDAKGASSGSPLAGAVTSVDGTPAGNGPLTIRARSQSWVQVRDAAGVVMLQRNLAVGEEVSVSGTLPMAVVVGRADATDVIVRGKPFDLLSIARENVARFEVR